MFSFFKNVLFLLIGLSVGWSALKGNEFIKQPDYVIQDNYSEFTAKYESKIVTNITSWCPSCKQAKAFLSANNLAYEERDVDTNSK